MRQLARPMPIGRLSMEARVLYTAFLAFLAVGMISSVWLYADSFEGLTARGATEYYLGATPPAQETGAGGPALDLPMPEEAGATERLRLAKPARQVLETFHFHLFTVPVVLLIVGHLFMLTAVSTRWKVGWLVAAAFATLLHLLAPLAVRFLSPELGWLMPLSAILAAVAWTPLVIWPVWEMWRPERPRAEASG